MTPVMLRISVLIIRGDWVIDHTEKTDLYTEHRGGYASVEGGTIESCAGAGATKGISYTYRYSSFVCPGQWAPLEKGLQPFPPVISKSMNAQPPGDPLTLP